MTRCVLVLASRMETDNGDTALHVHREVHRGTITECSLEAERVLMLMRLDKENGRVADPFRSVQQKHFSPVYPRSGN